MTIHPLSPIYTGLPSTSLPWLPLTHTVQAEEDSSSGEYGDEESEEGQQLKHDEEELELQIQQLVSVSLSLSLPGRRYLLAVLMCVPVRVFVFARASLGGLFIYRSIALLPDCLSLWRCGVVWCGKRELCTSMYMVPYDFRAIPKCNTPIPSRGHSNETAKRRTRNSRSDMQ